MIKTVQFLAILLVALCLVPGGAHLLELPNKIGLPREEYFTVQQIYRGWALAGAVLAAALLATAALAVLSRPQPAPFAFAAGAFLLIVATLAIFLVWTYPANQATDNWTRVPEHWQALRRQWEYAHAASALLTLAALAAAVASALTWVRK